MSKQRVEARDRLVAAALRFAAAERGGLDNDDSEEELFNADEKLADATFRYQQALLDEDRGSQAPAGEQVAE